MCGIAALSIRDPSVDLHGVITSMVDRMRHRGPDHQAVRVWGSAGTALGHDRLSIIDLSPAGNQPMCNEDETVWVVCNGEIYNHRDLRKRLTSRGHVLRSRSDSETLVHLYEEHGTDLCEQLHGMFAFVIYDAKRDLLFCARDRLGKKPIVYAEGPCGVSIASEIPAARLIPRVDTSIDPEGIALYLLRNLRHIPDPWTAYRGIRRLPPGHAMIVRAGTVERLWRYWNPDFAIDPRTTAADVLAAFDRAVDRRTVADIEVAALLSGGVDSSAIVERMVRTSAARVRTYALGRDAEDEELVRARRVAATLGTNHREFYFDAERAHRDFLSLLRIHGEPIALLPLLHALELFRHVRADGIKVVLTGHGADEIFFGYGGFRRMAWLSVLLDGAPGLARRAVAGMVAKLPAPTAVHESALVAGARPGERKAQLYRDEASRLWPRLFDTTAAGLRVEIVDDWLRTWLRPRPPEAFVDESAVLGLLHENAHSVTIAGDLPAMATSVEVRCPFLDQDLVQVAWRTPYRAKVHLRPGEFQGKIILKEALRGRLGQDVLYAPKRGFGYHIREDEVLRGPWRGAVDAAFRRLEGRAGPFRQGAVQSLKAGFDDGGGVPAMLIAKLYALEEGIG